MPITRSAIDLLAEQLERRFKRGEADRLAVAVELMALDQGPERGLAEQRQGNA